MILTDHLLLTTVLKRSEDPVALACAEHLAKLTSNPAFDANNPEHLKHADSLKNAVLLARAQA